MARHSNEANLLAVQEEMAVTNFDFLVAEGVLVCVEEPPGDIAEIRTNGVEVGVVKIPKHWVFEGGIEFDRMFGASRDRCGFSLLGDFFARRGKDLRDYRELLFLCTVVLNVDRVMDLRRVSPDLRSNLLATHQRTFIFREPDVTHDSAVVPPVIP